MKRHSLDHDTVVQQAALMADRDGLESLSLSALAQQLGIRPPSLYNHIASSEALRHDLQIFALGVFTECAQNAAIGRSGRDALLNMGCAFFSLARKRPGVWSALQRAPARNDKELRTASSGILRPFETVLAHMGLSSTESIHTMRALRALVQGFTTLAAQGGFGLPEDVEESFALALEKLVPAESQPSEGRRRL